MDILTRKTLHELIQLEADSWYVSIYIPTIRAGAETQQNPIKFKNMIRNAEMQLDAVGVESDQIKSLLAPARNLLDDEPFWQQQRDGLAMFMTANKWVYYRLPIHFDEGVYIGRQFHIKSLMPLFDTDGRYYVLTLASGNVHLFEGTHFAIDEVTLEQLPTSIDEALWYEDPERQLQHHASVSANTDPGGKTIHHGHGVNTDQTKKERILRFFRQVDEGINIVLDGEQMPLVLIGQEHILSLYREANTYANLVEQGVATDPQSMTTEEIHRAAWAVVRTQFEEKREQVIAQFKQESVQEQIVDQIADIVPASTHGRVDILLVNQQAQVYGEFDPESATVEIDDTHDPENQELINISIIHTLDNGGMVYTLEPDMLPTDTNVPAMAMLRY